MEMQEQTKQRYIADEIGNEYQKWESPSLIKITAPTGTGKSYFVLHVLLRYAWQNGRRILYLVNRKILREQLKAELRDISYSCMPQNIWIEDYIDIYTYQEIESRLKFGNQDPFNSRQGNLYYYIIYDECHYFYADADFNTSSTESFYYLTGYFKKETQIFMSATMEKMWGIISERVEKRLLPTITDNGVGGMSTARRDLRKFEYKVPINYDYIDLYYFEKFDEIPGIIADASTAKEKWLIFVNSIDKGKKLKKELPELTKDDMQYDGSDEKLYTEEDVIFIDARYENDDESKESVEELKEKKVISKKIIITTSVMDNGISFEDKELRNIIIMTDTQEEFIQMLGRKRQDGKKVKVYICSRDISYFKHRFSSVDSVLKDYDVYSNYEKQVQFPFLWQERVLDDMITNHYKYNSIIKFCYAEKGQIYCNPISIQKLTDLRAFYKTMCEEIGKDKHAFLKQQVSWLGVREEQAKEFIRQTDDHRSEQMRKQLKERLDELLGENREIELSAKDNIEKVKKNGKLMNAFMYFIDKVEGVRENKIKDLRQNDRPVQVEEFNSCMQEANLEYKMESEKKGLYIIRR